MRTVPKPKKLSRSSRRPRGNSTVQVAAAGQIRALVSEVALAEERERRRIASGLHDQIGHVLAIGRIRLGALRAMELPEEARACVLDVQRSLQEAIRATRSLTFELSSPVLFEVGLGPALESLAARTCQEQGLEVHVEDRSDAARPLAEDVRVVLYRAARELLLNVVKHAGARRVAIRLAAGGDRVELEVADDGRGFDTRAAGECFTERGGFGLFSIRERLANLGGRLEITSSPEHGTCVRLSAPAQREIPAQAAVR